MRQNRAFPARNLDNVCASAACRFVRVDACEPSFRTERANAPVDLPAAFAFAEKAPGRFMAPAIQRSFAISNPSQAGHDGSDILSS